MEVRRLARRDRNRCIGLRMAELQDAWRDRKLFLPGTLRVDFGNNLEPKLRLHSAPRQFLDAESWHEYLSLPDPEGGFAVTELNYDDARDDRREPRKDSMAEAIASAKEDVGRVSGRFRNARLRRTPPAWSFPACIWSVILAA